MKRNEIALRAEASGSLTDRAASRVGAGPPRDPTGCWWTQASLALVSAAVAAMTLGCSPHPGAAAVTHERAYAVHPDSIRADAGVVVADLIRMKISERVEEPSGRVTSPAVLSGRLFVENTSPDEPIRLIAGRIVYLDAQGEAIPLENGRAEPIIRFGASIGAGGRLEPGKVATELVYAEFPSAALAGNRLKAIRIHLTYWNLRSVTDEWKIRFPVSIVASRTGASSDVAGSHTKERAPQ